jgi:hypothetical protein
MKNHAEKVMREYLGKVTFADKDLENSRSAINAAAFYVCCTATNVCKTMFRNSGIASNESLTLVEQTQQVRVGRHGRNDQHHLRRRCEPNGEALRVDTSKASGSILKDIHEWEKEQCSIDFAGWFDDTNQQETTTTTAAAFVGG